MLRLVLIAITIVATVHGSLGLPLSLHTCRMMLAGSDAPGCPMCAASDAAIVAGGGDDEGACCSDEVVHQRVDPGATARVDIPMPLFVGTVVLATLDLLDTASPAIVTARRSHSPPALAARAQHAYLHNATFLI